MKKLSYLLAGALALTMAFAPALDVTAAGKKEEVKLNPQFTAKWKRGKDGVIRTQVPKREKNQQHALGLTVPKMDVVRVAFVGLGMRGPGAVQRFTHMKDVGLNVQIVALCDFVPERAQKVNDKYVVAAGMPRAAEYSGEDGYKQLCQRNDIDLVYIATDWNHHVPVALYAMEHGKNVAIEVPSAMSMKDCWDLINMSERTRKHCIQLENCCYDFFEMNTLNMAQQGIFGEILRVQGAYIHNLDPFWNAYWKEEGDKLGWRMKYNRLHKGDVYATHGLGPVCQVLNIHRGDRMKTLTAMETKAVHGPAYVKKVTGEDVTDFQNGDHTTTLISTENGKVIEIQHNVMNPRPYDRLYQLTGTAGFANKYPIEGYAIEGKNSNVSGVVNHEDLSGHGFLSPASHKALVEKYQHPLLKQIGEKAKKVGGHGGMDFIMDYRLVYCLQNGLPLDMDVYDLAEWCCLAELGYLSMTNNNAPVEVPDFTRGYWNTINGFKLHYAPGDEPK